MKLRRWQAESISKAFEQYCSNFPHYMCLATPGAGKTIMAAQLAKRLFDAGMIDMVMCFSPAIVVAVDFQRELEQQMGRRFNGRLGADGCSLTYQAMSALDNEFWEVLEKFRVFVIFDEIHHCAATEYGKCNCWGETIYRYIRGKSAYSLALTGTPWRSDNIPIVLADYCRESGKVHCDYSYGLAQAISDGVCREPRITAIDNTNIRVTKGSETDRYHSIKDLLSQSECSYQDLLENEVLIGEILRSAARRLDSLRQKAPNAGGLIVATSVSHARKIARILYAELNESAEIATYAEINPIATIQQFRSSSSRWIISVGMISEGTNLPRLQVCCYLTRVKTELYFRQVLGRILRSTGNEAEKGYFFIPAEPTLIEYALRISEDVPELNVLKFESINSERDKITTFQFDSKSIGFLKGDMLTEIDVGRNVDVKVGDKDVLGTCPTLSETYESCINISGYFVQKLLSINCSVLR